MAMAVTRTLNADGSGEDSPDRGGEAVLATDYLWSKVQKHNTRWNRAYYAATARGKSFTTYLIYYF